ncbi:MAG TPA: LPS export ABC transporter permease LptG [Nevskiaceae bacterium]|nr:LPS export ABC transporter permease LptG [Nevskiaceae bacterium]
MNRIDRYIMLSIFALSGIVALGLVSLYSFISFVGELDQQGDKGVSAGRIFLSTIVLAPSALYVLMPLVAMLGTLLGVGSLAAQSELTAMRAAGYSNLRIGGAGLMAGLALGLVAMLLGEQVAPAAEHYAEQVRRGDAAGSRTKPVWLRDGPNVFFIRRLSREDRFADAEIFRFDESLRLHSALHVDEAKFAGNGWELSDVSGTEFGEHGTKPVRHRTMTLETGLSPDLLKLYVLEADTVSIRGLHRLITYLDENGLDAEEQRLELWRKVIAPITIMAMVVFAVPFVFGPTRGGGAGQRLLIGVMVGVGFHLLNEVSANLGALYGWSAPVAAGAPTLALMIAAAVRLARAR